MRIHSLKSIAQRGTLIGAAFALVAAVLLPASSALADALNPLTDRSLTLSSSSPGWSYTDGSGNSKYAPPNSGANGQKTGNTFDFKVSSASDGVNPRVKTMSFQYCTQPAGDCITPGDNATHNGIDTAATSDLNVNFNASDTNNEVDSGDFTTVVDDSTGIVKAVPGFSNPDDPSDSTGVYAAKALTSSYTVFYKSGGTWTPSTGWTVNTATVQDGTGPDENTVSKNYIILSNDTGLGIPAGTEVKVVFFGTADNYITNPGSGAFFVKINTYKTEYGSDREDYDPLLTGTFDETDLAPAKDDYIIDGGVTVANVMNQSIQITTKVLETMQFSVGTVDPNTLSSIRPDDGDGNDTDTSELDKANGNASNIVTPRVQHQPCDTILKAITPSQPANVLKLGDQTAESSLSTNHTYSTHSYWRLSSNSSAGATVYYSGHTLSNTVGDQIDPIYSATPGDGQKAAPAHGAEQFGLALVNTGNADDTTLNGVTPAFTADTSGAPTHQNYSVNYAQETTYENGNDNGKTSIDTASLTADGILSNQSWHTPQLYPLVPDGNYDNGTGAIDSAPTTEFAFDPTSDTIPVALATEDSEVVDCVTGKMRYIANIAATTPAGIYTTKINYIAAPQY